jgi:potassium-transporting ATPase KdpC subunit
MRALFRPALSLLALLTLLTGVLYPAAVTLVARTVFPHRAGGSLVERGGRVVGSELVGQAFHAPKYLWGRPSATTPACDAAASSGSNLGPTNPALADAVGARVAALRAADPGNVDPIPVELVTASASGLDPHLSPAAARFQAGRIARARGLPRERVVALLERLVEGRDLGALGEPRINVLLANLALDELR